MAEQIDEATLRELERYCDCDEVCEECNCAIQECVNLPPNAGI